MAPKKELCSSHRVRFAFTLPDDYDLAEVSGDGKKLFGQGALSCLIVSVNKSEMLIQGPRRRSVLSQTVELRVMLELSVQSVLLELQLTVRVFLHCPVWVLVVGVGSNLAFVVATWLAWFVVVLTMATYGKRDEHIEDDRA